MNYIKSLVIVILLLLPISNAYAVRHYTRATDGIISDIVTAVHMDPSGSLWVGTDSGISRYNGLTWTQYKTTNSSLPANFTNCFFTDPANGDMWIGTTAGVAVFDAPNWENPGLTLPGYDVESILMDSNGDIWFATDGGIAKYRYISLKVTDTYTSAEGLPSNFIRQMVLDSFDYFWLATANGVSRFDDAADNFVNYDQIVGFPDNNVKSIAVEFGVSDDTIWLATPAGAGRNVGGVWTTLTTFDGLLSDDLKHVMVDSSGNKWFATAADGMSQLSGVGWTDYTYALGNLVDNRCITSATDNSENVWIGTKAGLTRVSDNGFVSFDKILYLNPDALAYVSVNDPVMNTNPASAEVLNVNVYSDTDGAGITLTLTETGVDTGVFSSNAPGSELGFSYSASNAITRTLLVTKGDSIFALYAEADTGKNRLAVANYSEIVDFDDNLLLDSPCFVATAAYSEELSPNIVEKIVVNIMKVLNIFDE